MMKSLFAGEGIGLCDASNIGMHKLVHTEPSHSIGVLSFLLFSSFVNNTMPQLDTIYCPD